MDEVRGDLTELEAAVEALYDVFVQPLPAVMDYCRHCDDAAYEAALHGPLRDLDPELVDRYVWDAMHHTGDEDDFRHFVPRVLELLAADALPFVDHSLLLGRLTEAGWSGWAPAEQDAVLRMVVALWDRVLDAHPSGHDIDDLLCGLGLAFGDLQPLLAAWGVDERLSARRHLRDVLLATADWLVRGEPFVGFWSHNRGGIAAERQLRAWFQNPMVHDVLTTAAAQVGVDERWSFELAARLALDPLEVDADAAAAGRADLSRLRPRA